MERAWEGTVSPAAIARLAVLLRLSVSGYE